MLFLRKLAVVLAILAVSILTSPISSAEERHGLGTSEAVDLDTLESELRKTDAIGLTTKISLKQTLDGLITDFRAFHSGKADLKLAELETRFHGLLDETMSHLKSGDPMLYRTLLASRSGLWDMISDGPNFQALVADRQKTVVAAGPKR